MHANDNKVYLKKCILIWYPESRDYTCVSYARLNSLTYCVNFIFVGVQAFVAIFLIGFFCDLIGRAYVAYLLCVVRISKK